MPRTLITGAADGIGRALALRLADEGHAILGVDLDRERSERTCAELRSRGVAARFECVDLGDLDATRDLGRRLARELPFDVVVLNAGINAVGRFEHACASELEAVLRVNLESPLLLATALLATGRLAPGGTLVFVSSLSHQAGYPGAAVYAATKDGLASYARSLSVALAPRGLRVLRVFPGPTRTAHAERYAPRGSDATKRMPPERVAEAVVQAIARGRPALVPGLSNRVAAALGRWFPRTMDRLMARLLLQRIDTPPL